jgi:hypothetical protein
VDSTEAASALEHAEQLSSKARRAARWYVVFLILFGLASAAMAASFSLVGSARGSLTVTLTFLAVTFVLLGWGQRQSTTLVGMGRIHLAVMLSWGGLWAVTVLVGSFVFPGEPGWWVSGGIAMAAPCLVGSYVTQRRTR